MKTAAIIVTYNRKQLLAECLEAVIKQTKHVEGIYIVDNNSTDGTESLLFRLGYIKELPFNDSKKPWRHDNELIHLNKQPTTIHYIKMNQNTGGAGGFYEGLKAAYQDGYHWFWMMDDDAIPLEDALEKLLEKIEYLDELSIGFACSKVLWKDGTVHKMNIPGIMPLVNDIPFNSFEEKKVLLVRSASFVSLLINRNVVKKVGFPIKEFFIWVDDVEYTSRITRTGFLGLYVKDSIVVHKTKHNYSSHDVYDWRFYYLVRNLLWYRRLHQGRLRYLAALAISSAKTFKLPKGVRLRNIKACFDSLKLPKIDYPSE